MAQTGTPPIEKLYPLPSDERRALVRVVLASDALLVAVGYVLAVILALFDGTCPGDVPGALLWGWVECLKRALVPDFAMLWLTATLLVLSWGSYLVLWRVSEGFRSCVYRIRQGMNGELPRLPLVQIAVLMALVGFAEEFAFRFGVLGVLAVLLGPVLPAWLAAALALVVSTALFTVMHSQYHDPWSLGTVCAVGLVLGAAYLLTGSLLAVWTAHSLYDFADTLMERHRMRSEPDYFRGRVPVSVSKVP